MEIAEKLKKQRKAVGMTQEVLAEKLNVSRQTISNWENGRSLPDIYSLVVISEIYGISLDELIKGDVQMVQHIKKESQVKKMINRAGWISIVGGVLALIGYFAPFSANIGSFVKGMGIGSMMVGVLILGIIKIVTKLNR